MILPPLVLRIRVTEKGRRKLRLWIPLFLLWPGLLLLGAVLAPVAIAAAIILALRGQNGTMVLLSGPLCLYFACMMRGLRLDIRDGDTQLYISLW